MIPSIGSIPFIDRINQRYLSKRTTNELVKQALILISAASSSPKFLPQWLRRFGGNLDLLLRVMLECAPSPHSRRYVACAILGCRVGERNSQETTDNVQKLAIIWFGHLFWAFKTAGMDGIFPNYDDVLDQYIREEVIQRDGNRCVITGVYDWRRAQRDQVPKANLDYACILPRTTRVDASDEKSERNIHDYFSSSSWDILQQYMSISPEDEDTMLEELESAANAITMELDAGQSFQQFLFSLESDQVPEEYIIVAYEHTISELCTIPPRQDRIAFCASSLPQSGIPSPSPLFLQIHATISKILFLSRAGEVIDRINDFLGRSHPVLRRLDFESAKVTLELSESVERMFASSNVKQKKRRLSESEDLYEDIPRREPKKRKVI
ncbi:hypothetical protein AMATHDRAFT_62362 [Amanita thiersii Skay4041]|uniref:Uncharacterized protein n=1 Tax=Amanita thiersii Skay4041 TaxID=703135 RepID=A0A2A9NNE0_9AGAR|nr:hypothetical protein AMATHDRAFT_62362 [Amanita thiersii Skay4041]